MYHKDVGTNYKDWGWDRYGEIGTYSSKYSTQSYGKRRHAHVDAGLGWG